MKHEKLSGLIAATYTPLSADGSLNLKPISSYVQHLIESGIQGLYVCGSTGEGMSLTTSERKAVTQAFIDASAGRVPVIVQVGHNCVADAKDLAAHAASAGADVLSATCPSYFKATDIQTLANCMADLAAAAPDLPFYYYHIPALTGSAIDIIQFLETAKNDIPNLVGLKYTDTKLHEFQACLNLHEGALDIVFGCDEMLLGAIATGATAAIGSTYNVISPTYLQLISAWDNHDLETARFLQKQANDFIRLVYRFPFHSAMKEILSMQGFAMGSCRLPQQSLIASDRHTLRASLQTLPAMQGRI